MRNRKSLLSFRIANDSGLHNQACVCPGRTALGQCARINNQYRLDDLIACQHNVLQRATE